MRYLIGDFSQISRLSITTLRYYHECGLLEPDYIDTDSGYRYYTDSSLEKARIINELKEMDFSLKEIKDIISNCEDDYDLLESMESKYLAIQEKATKYEKIAKKLEYFIKISREARSLNADKSSTIITKTVEETFVASIRFKGKYHQVPACFDYLYKHCEPYSSGMHFTMYYDNDFKEDDADIECCVPVTTPVTGNDIKNKTVQGGKALSIIHNGSYDSLDNTHKVLREYAHTNNIDFQSPIREVYVKGRWMVMPRKPEKFVTEIQMYLP